MEIKEKKPGNSAINSRMQNIVASKKRYDETCLRKEGHLSTPEATVSLAWELLYAHLNKMDTHLVDVDELNVITSIIQRLASGYSNVIKSTDTPCLPESEPKGIPGSVIKQMEEVLHLL